MNLIELLTHATQQGASDLHLSVGVTPMMRVDGDLCLIGSAILEQSSVMEMLTAIMNDEQRLEYLTYKEIDFSFSINNLARFRVNAFTQARGAAAAFRILSTQIKSFEELGLPPILAEIASFSRGLVLVTGATGSGKTTTVAAMVDHINRIYPRHIITIEDPIEFIHDNKYALINQREVSRDTTSFRSALHAALRADPDIIMIGELRDLDTIRLALTAAETGHLVLATLHTNSASKTINRIVDVFPGEEKSIVRSVLSESLQAVVAQHLVKKLDKGRVAAFEVMLCTPAIRHLIRDNKIAQLYSSIQTGQSFGMQTMEQYLAQLVKAGVISEEYA